MKLYTCPTCKRTFRVLLPYAVCPTCDVTGIDVASRTAKRPVHLTGKQQCQFYMDYGEIK